MITKNIFPISLLLLLISCYNTILSIVIIMSLILVSKLIKEPRLTYVSLITVLLIMMINSYLSIETKQRLSTITAYSNAKKPQFTGKLIYTYHNKIIIKTQKGYTLTGYLPKNHLFKLNLDDTVRLTGTYNPPSTPTNPGQYNNLKYAIHHKKLGSIYIKSLKVLKKNTSVSLNKASYHVKKKITKHHQKSLPMPHSSIYSALIFGENYAELNHDLKQLFKKAGLIHAIVVSGSQVSLVLGMCHIVINWLGIYRYYQLIFLVPISIFFFILTGGGESVLRAIIMAHTLFIIKFGLGYRSSTLHVISFTAFLMIIMDPFVIYKIGAILSFLATFSLVFGTDLVKQQLPKRFSPKLNEFISIGIAPWMFTTPVLIIKFQSLPIGSLVSNIILVQLIEYTVIIGFTGTLLGIVLPPIAHVLHQLAWVCIDLIIHVSTWVTHLPFADIPINQHNLTTGLFLLACFICFKTSLPLKTKLTSCLCLILIGINSYFIRYNNSVIITQLDIGQGDATLIKTNQFTCLIDTGPPYDKRLGSITYSVLLPALRYYGIQTLDALILTHFDQDHVGNLKPLLATIPIKKIIHNGNLHSYLKKHNISLPNNTLEQSVCYGDRIRSKLITISFLNPCNNTAQLSKNNQSLVFKLSKPPYSMLFTGDIEKEMEYRLLQHHSNSLPSTLLKVAHHGSKTSTTHKFLSTVKPIHSIISAGKNNSYNHPHLAVLATLNDYGKIWRTDQTGAIIIHMTKTLTIKSFIKK
ncbi:DNA internalization-related competence protein ComEC/Rec2 [bacterium]|nr:DNA internalization-related competence protein ComEC/Rec2 [bacterium]